MYYIGSWLIFPLDGENAVSISVRLPPLVKSDAYCVQFSLWTEVEAANASFVVSTSFQERGAVLFRKDVISKGQVVASLLITFSSIFNGKR